MSHCLKANLYLICAVAVLGVGATRSWTQQESPKSTSVGVQAATVVLKHYALNSHALEAGTQQPLPNNGAWSLGKVPPAACSQIKETCVEVFYEVPAESVRCSWVVVLNADGPDGKFLEDNDDSER